MMSCLSVRILKVLPVSIVEYEVRPFNPMAGMDGEYKENNKRTVTNRPFGIGHPRFLGVDAEEVPDEGERKGSGRETETVDCPSSCLEKGENGSRPPRQSGSNSNG